MGKYLLRRILQMIPVVLGTTLLVYALVFALPGDPVKAMFGDKPVNEAVAAQIRAEYLLRTACHRRDRPRLPRDHQARPDGLRVRSGFRRDLRCDLRPEEGQVVRYRHPDLLPAAHLRADLRHRLPLPVLPRCEVASAAARAKGMDNKSVMLRHVLRNSMIPVVTYLGQDLGALMGGAMISETIFNVHGIGYLTYQSILKGEGNLVVSIVTLLMLIFVVCNLLVDMLYAALDPRIRYA